MPNLNFIKKHGINKFAGQQDKRIKSLKIILRNFDDGKSKCFFCKAANLLDVKNLENSLDEATRKIKADNIRDIKIKAKTLKMSLMKSLNKD
jgi:Cys-tRNA synthase (O-phospho-L-seryl-tRNA:Cys-tRNA synthase)